MTNDLYLKIKNEYKNKKILIVGLGLLGGGVGLAKFFAELGARVIVTDLKSKDDLQESLKVLKNYPINFSLGGHKLVDFLSADVIFKGPSVPWDLKGLKKKKKKEFPLKWNWLLLSNTFQEQLLVLLVLEENQLPAL